MKKILCVILALCMSVSMVACAKQESQASSTTSKNEPVSPTGVLVEVGRNFAKVKLLKVTEDGLNIRSGPSTQDTTIYFKASVGDYYELAESGAQWNKLIYRDDDGVYKEAYASAQYSVVEEYSASDALVKLGIPLSTATPEPDIEDPSSESSTNSEDGEA